MRFYIDFENVGCGGLKGIPNLKSEDIVSIYYSNNPNLDMETVIKLFHSNAKIDFQKLPDEIKNMNLKNALDIIILNDIGRLNNSEKVAIISNDTGYDNMIQKFLQKGKNIVRAATVSKISTSTVVKQITSNSKIDEQEISALFNKKGELSGFASSKQKIMNIIKNSKTRSEINNTLTKSFPNNTGKIMQALKPYIKNLPGK
ncbi:MAG: hypothetical protein IKP69_05500 [Oscillospiraceae bacterium]|nr:hypothetical protein [Oscillospiraceae bacterium]